MGDLGKLIVAKGFKKLPKVQKIAKSGHTVQERMDNRCTGPSILGSFDPKISIFEGKTELDYLHLAPKRFEIIRRPF